MPHLHVHYFRNTIIYVVHAEVYSMIIDRNELHHHHLHSQRSIKVSRISHRPLRPSPVELTSPLLVHSIPMVLVLHPNAGIPISVMMISMWGDHRKVQARRCSSIPWHVLILSLSLRNGMAESSLLPRTLMLFVSLDSTRSICSFNAYNRSN